LLASSWRTCRSDVEQLVAYSQTAVEDLEIGQIAEALAYQPHVVVQWLDGMHCSLGRD